MKTAQIVCEYWFEASHRLFRADWPQERNDAVFGKCARLHGHSYRLLVTLRGPVDPATGMVINFSDVKAVVREKVIHRLDHSHLNDLLGDLSTAENILCWIGEQLDGAFGETQLRRVELWETRTACAFLDREDLDELARSTQSD
jgi:6-pyruvoyltetrahydropterin/6-carboxytetrahydropterin synthase